MQNPQDLVAAIANTLKQAHTQALDISFNELLDMHISGELNISPNYQRLFRWSEGQQSRFIESLLLEMPVPPIFVIEEESSKYQLIDGLQRISSYLHFRGKLSSPDADAPIRAGEFLTLVDCDIVPALNGLAFSDLPTSLQIRLKRAFIRVEVVRKESDPRFKYHMFKRLNTGGDKLSDQQIRNATIRMLGDQFPDFLDSLRMYEPFRTCITWLTQEARRSSIDEELVLRFFAFKNNRDSFKHEVGEFLTDYMENSASGNFDYAAEEAVFKKTFDLLEKSIGELAFSPASKKTNKLISAFGIYHYESITVALQTVLGKLDSSDAAQMEKLRVTLTEVKLNSRFIEITTGGGKNSPGPLRDRIDFVEKALANAFS